VAKDDHQGMASGAEGGARTRAIPTLLGRWHLPNDFDNAGSKSQDNQVFSGVFAMLSKFPDFADLPSR
jgi:hypothetical protein